MKQFKYKNLTFNDHMKYFWISGEEGDNFYIIDSGEVEVTGASC